MVRTAVDILGKNVVRWDRIDKDGPGLHVPKKTGDVGWDLEAAQDVYIAPMTAVDVPCNVRLWLPDDIWAEIRARSSIARRNLQVDAGTIDPGYRGPLYALVRNMQLPIVADAGVAMDMTHENAIKIKKGERVAQVVFHRVTRVAGLEVEQIEVNSERGEDGFGSTGR